MNLLLLRGLMREKRYWHDDFIKILQQAGHKVLCLDLPGLGDKTDTPFPYSIRDAYLLLREDFLREKTDGPWALVSISLGSMIALEWADHMPSDFEKIAVINPSALNLGLPWERLVPKAMAQSLRILREDRTEKREELILKMTTNFAYKDPEIVKKWTEIASQSSFSKETATRQLIAASRFVAPDKLIIPCLILASDQDRMVSVKCSQRLAKRLKAEIRIHPTAGHDIAMDDPDWLAKQIIDWL